MEKKYYIIKTTKNGIEYKRTKCLEYWSRTPEGCWKFSKQGAEMIVDRYNKAINPNGEAWYKIGIHYNIKEA